MIKQMRQIRLEYDTVTIPIVRRLDEIADIGRKCFELPEELAIERAELMEKWNAALDTMWTKFRELGNPHNQTSKGD